MKALARRCFNPIGWLFFSLGKQTFVAEHDGAIVAGVCLGTPRLPGGRVAGHIKWIFSAPEARGMGAAQALVDRAGEWFTEQRCTTWFAQVEGYNVSSSKLFATRGYERVRFADQVRRWGVGLPLVWFGIGHGMDLGHYLWVRDASAGTESAAAGSSASSATAWLGMLVANTLIGYLVYLRWGGLAPFADLHRLWYVPVTMLVLIGVRSLSMYAAAAAVRLPVEYRGWDTGAVLSLVITAVFGGILPVPGSLYPRSDDYSYCRELSRLGPIAFAGVVSVLIVGWAIWAVQSYVGLSPRVDELLTTGLLFARYLAIFDALAVFFPLASYNGRRVLDWLLPAWLLPAAGTVALLVVG